MENAVPIAINVRSFPQKGTKICFISQQQKKMTQELTILDAAEPLLFISKFTGYSLFTIDRKTWRARVTKLDILAILLTIWINLGLNCIYWKSIISVEANVNTISKVSLPILVYLDYVINVIGVLWIFMNSCKISELLRLFKEIDENFMDIGGCVDYRREKMNAIRSLTAVVVTSIGFIIMDMFILTFSDFVTEKLFAVVIFWSYFCTMTQVSGFLCGV